METQKKFIGRMSCTVKSVCEKVKTLLGFALCNSWQMSYQVATEAAFFFPCSGNGAGQSRNNRGSNGNYWSSTFNSARNARNLNFNSTGVNPTNNNNRYNGFGVRPVQHSLSFFFLTY
jgi:hypothetical protein